MKDYITVTKNAEYKLITICFMNENDKPFAIGEKMNQINEEAYMNGYNWEAFFNYILSRDNSDLLNLLETDPEAGCYFAHYPLTNENINKANLFAEIIEEFIEDEDKIFDILKNEGHKIEWD